MTGNDLRVRDLVVRFGGLIAVRGLSLDAPQGTITGLIGPNGAGKSTTFNACAGLVRPDAGSVTLGQTSLDGLSAPRRAQHGLGRTFQRMELIGAMTVLENVELGPETLLAGRGALRQLVASRRERAEIRRRAHEALERCGILHLAPRAAHEVSTGQRRLVELARVLASGFSMLLLDEPSSGLDAAETVAFGEILNEVAAREHRGILLVEHDMALVRMVCSFVYVLDFGQLIYQGPTAETLGSDIVRAAYLGRDEVA